jgi:hypothetical protein
LIRVTDFDIKSPGLGVGVTYRNDNPLFAVDIYIYNKGVQVPSGHEAQAIKAELGQAIGDIQTMAAQGYYADVKMTGAPTPCRAANVVFQCAVLDFLGLPQNRTPMRSRTLVRGNKGHFVKIRISWQQERDAEAAPMAERFLTAVAKLLPPN